ncbi:hypothetical protein BpHYR1_051389 [Brachionus plicatilis]|uniref:Uncharacterized protein n=1 Tax=Brachionus plicatilis TaxID=10195 RepID=A0A3M7P289_BRAPC|nr:hypothetical protein BpHYR1_051389 [Brachionus plicatilis]
MDCTDERIDGFGHGRKFPFNAIILHHLNTNFPKLKVFKGGFDPKCKMGHGSKIKMPEKNMNIKILGRGS